jgi:uncharacterized protein
MPRAALESRIAAEFVRDGRSDHCRIIDIHGHIGGYYGGSMPSAPLDRMLERMRRAGVERIVASHHVALAYDVAAGNAAMADVVEHSGGTVLGYWVVNPNSGDATALAGLHRRPGFVGLKLWPDYHQTRVTSPKYEASLRYADEHGLLVLCHCWGNSHFAGPSMLAEVALAHPNARFLAAHSGHGEWEVAGRAAREVPNLFLDLASVPNPNDARLDPESGRVPLSAAATPPLYGVIEYLVDLAGPEKILFGSDLPWYSQHFHAGAVIFARIPEEARRLILRENALKLLASLPTVEIGDSH